MRLTVWWVALATTVFPWPAAADSCVYVPRAPEVSGKVQQRLGSMDLGPRAEGEAGPMNCEAGERMHSQNFLRAQQVPRVVARYCDLSREVVTVDSGLNVRGQRLVGLVCVFQPEE